MMNDRVVNHRDTFFFFIDPVLSISELQDVYFSVRLRL